MNQPETAYDGSDYNIRPAYHLKKWKKKKHFVQPVPIYLPDKTDLSVSNSIGNQSTHSNTTFSHVTRSFNPHHRLYTVPITAEIILEQNSLDEKKPDDSDEVRSLLFSEYLSIVNKPTYTGLIDDHTDNANNDSLLFTGKVNPLPKQLMLEKQAAGIKTINKNETGVKSRALLNDLIDEIQAIEVSSHDAEKGSATIIDVSSFDLWKKAYFAETGLFGSIALFVETQYCELKDREKTENNKLTKLKAVIVADLLLKLVQTLEVHSKMLGPLVYELLNFVFCEYATSPKSFSNQCNMQDFLSMHTYFDRFNEHHGQNANGDEEIDYIREGSQMNELVRKFQTVSLVFDIATRFLRDACFSMWKSLIVRAEHYRKLCIRKILKYRFKRLKAYKRSHINAEIELMETELVENELEERRKQFRTMFEAKRSKRRSIRASIRASMVRSSVVGRTESRENGEIRSILKSRSGNEPLNYEGNSYERAIANAIAAVHSNQSSRMPTPSKTRRMSGNIPSPTTMTPNRRMSGTLPSPITIPSPNRRMSGTIPSPTNMMFPLSSSPIFDDPLHEFRMLTINVIPPGQLSPGSGSNNPTPYAYNGPPSGTSANSLRKEINPSASNRRNNMKSPASTSPSRTDRSSFQSTAPSVVTPVSVTSKSRDKTSGSCQTPAEWIANNPIPNARGGKRTRQASDQFDTSSEVGAGLGQRQLSTLSKEAVTITATRVSPFRKPDFKITPHGHAHLTVNRNSIETAQWNINHQKYQLSFSISAQLISYVYSSMFPEEGQTHPAIDFSFHSSLLSYTKELLLYKYKVTSVADKFYKGLIACCLSQSSINNRIKLFARLCGVTSATVSQHNFDLAVFTSFINMIGVLFKKDPWEIRNVMNSKKRDIYRKAVLSVLHKIVPTIHLRDQELYQNIVDDITNLPVTNSNINMKVLDPAFDTVDIDDLLLLLMEYVDLERSENMELKMEKMKERIILAKKLNIIHNAK